MAAPTLRGEPIERRANGDPVRPMIVVRDPLGAIIEETHFDAERGIVIALDDLPAVGQISIVPPEQRGHVFLPQGIDPKHHRDPETGVTGRLR